MKLQPAPLGNRIYSLRIALTNVGNYNPFYPNRRPLSILYPVDLGLIFFSTPGLDPLRLKIVPPCFAIRVIRWPQSCPPGKGDQRRPAVYPHLAIDVVQVRPDRTVADA